MQRLGRFCGLTAPPDGTPVWISSALVSSREPDQSDSCTPALISIPERSATASSSGKSHLVKGFRVANKKRRCYHSRHGLLGANRGDSIGTPAARVGHLRRPATGDHTGR